jgi:hypothetical protein
VSDRKKTIPQTHKRRIFQEGKQRFPFDKDDDKKKRGEVDRNTRLITPSRHEEILSRDLISTFTGHLEEWTSSLVFPSLTGDQMDVRRTGIQMEKKR